MVVLERFKPELQEIVRKSFASLTEIQKAAMPPILAGRNTLVIAPTGSGKTEAAFLPVMNGLIGSKKPGILVLYIAPLRSLNRDMLRRMEEWCAQLGLRVEVRHGDTTTSQRSRQRLKPPQILITTPETLQAILPAKVMRKHLASVEYVIIDEMHDLVRDALFVMACHDQHVIIGEVRCACICRPRNHEHVASIAHAEDDAFLLMRTRVVLLDVVDEYGVQFAQFGLE